MSMDGDGFTLVVRAPNQQIDDVVVNCDNQWTVGQLKDHLSEVYPYKPVASNQKLIYQGKLLNNTSYLKDVFKSYDDNDVHNDSFTIHMMCHSIETKSTQNVKKAPTTPTTAPKPSSSSNAWNTPNVPYTQPNWEELSRSWSPESLAQSIQNTYGNLNDGQVAWVQQAYMQYLTQYMQLMNSQGFSSPYISSINLPVSGNADNAANNDEQRQPVQNNADLFNNNNNVNNNNNNNNNNIDDGINRDWLDNFYMLSRIVVLFSIVYFYSSPLRFAAVTLLGFLLYLYHSGFFRTHIPFPENNARADNNPILGNDNPVPDLIERRERIEESNNNETNESRNDTSDNNNNGNNNQPNDNQVQRRDLLSLTWVFVTSFFTSLIPDVPEVV